MLGFHKWYIYTHNQYKHEKMSNYLDRDFKMNSSIGSVKSVHQSTPSELIISARVIPVVTAASLSTTIVCDHEITELLCPGGIETFENTVVVVEKLPDGTEITTIGVADCWEVEFGVAVSGVWNIITQVISGYVLRTEKGVSNGV